MKVFEEYNGVPSQMAQALLPRVVEKADAFSKAYNKKHGIQEEGKKGLLGSIKKFAGMGKKTATSSSSSSSSSYALATADAMILNQHDDEGGEELSVHTDLRMNDQKVAENYGEATNSMRDLFSKYGKAKTARERDDLEDEIADVAKMFVRMYNKIIERPDVKHKYVIADIPSNRRR
jgi:hypothetical protein